MMQITFIICFLTIVIIKEYKFDRFNIVQRINVANIKLKTLMKPSIKRHIATRVYNNPAAIVDELVTSKHIVT